MKKMANVSIAFNRELFGQLVRQYRIDAQLTQAEVGELCDMQQSAISAIELGRENYLTVSSLCRIVNALDIPVWRYSLWIVE